MLDAVVRGIFNDDAQMTDAKVDAVRESIQRELDEKKGGPRKSNPPTRPHRPRYFAEQETIRDYVKDTEKVAATP